MDEGERNMLWHHWGSQPWENSTSNLTFHLEKLHNSGKEQQPCGTRTESIIKQLHARANAVATTMYTHWTMCYERIKTEHTLRRLDHMCEPLRKKIRVIDRERENNWTPIPILFRYCDYSWFAYRQTMAITLKLKLSTIKKLLIKKEEISNLKNCLIQNKCVSNN